jgi:putative ABC transport system substrate-binding protein
MDRLGRRQFVQGLGVAGLVLLAGCGQWPGQTREPPAKVPRIGFLAVIPPELTALHLDALRQGLRELGYVEGQNIVIERRSADGQVDRLPELAQELARLPVEVIVAEGALPIRAAIDATDTIPIVMTLGGGDPVGQRLIDSLARPGGNVTGLSSFQAELSAKRLELFREAVPGLSRVAFLWTPSLPYREREFTETAEAANTLGVELQSLELHDPHELDGVLDAALKERADALLSQDNTLTIRLATRIADFTVRNRLPLMRQTSDLVTAGALMSYGPSNAEQFRRAAYYVDRILRGAKPADLPVEQPREFEFVINLKTAQALGLTLPEHVLLQATEVIQ